MSQNPSAGVKAAFELIPEPARTTLMEARARIFELAREENVGALTETLKWGQPSYLTEETKAGSTIRLGVQNGEAVAFFICNTSLVDGFRADFPDALTYHGNRAITLEQPFPVELDICFVRALTYHRAKIGA